MPIGGVAGGQRLMGQFQVHRKPIAQLRDQLFRLGVSHDASGIKTHRNLLGDVRHGA